MPSIIQDWVAELGLRHQGVLMAAVRGCDGAPKEDTCKIITRMYRGCIMNAHCGDINKAKSFMLPMSYEFREEVRKFTSDFDKYPNHFVMHMVHASEILGYYYPEEGVRNMWLSLYLYMVKKFHMNPETKEQLDIRLNPDEEMFADQQRAYGE